MMHLPFSLSLFVLPLLASAQSSSSITGSVTGSAISGASSAISGSATSAVASSGASSSPSSTATAEYPSLSGYSVCVTTCLQLSIAVANCTSIADVDCYCGVPAFEDSITDCIIKDDGGCPAELATAEDLASQFCNLAATSTSLSFTVTSVPVSSTSSSSSSMTTSRSSSSATSPSLSSTVSSSSGSASSAASTSNAAVASRPGQIASSTLFGVAVALLCAAIGGRLVV